MDSCAEEMWWRRGEMKGIPPRKEDRRIKSAQQLHRKNIKMLCHYEKQLPKFVKGTTGNNVRKPD